MLFWAGAVGGLDSVVSRRGSVPLHNASVPTFPSAAAAVKVKGSPRPGFRGIRNARLSFWHKRLT
jgi:hypothetical protein